MLSKKIKHLKYQNRNFSINSKKVNKNDIFFAIEGSKQSGSLYSSEALSKGAYKVITSKNIRNKINRIANFRSCGNPFAIR